MRILFLALAVPFAAFAEREFIWLYHRRKTLKGMKTT